MRSINTSTKPTSRRGTDGFTLMELAIVLSAIGLIVGAVWTAATQAINSRKGAQAMQEVLTVLEGYRALYSVRGIDAIPGGGEVTVTQLGINNNIFPSNLVQGTAAYSPWGQPVDVVVNSASGIFIIFWSLNRSQCITMGTQEAQQPDLLGSYVGPGASPNPRLYPPAGTDSRMTLSDIEGYCSDTAPNSVIFLYPLN